MLINSHEELAHRIEIKVPCETITEPIPSGEIKHHFLCDGYVHWKPDDDHVAQILDYPNFHSLTHFALKYDTESVMDQVEFSDDGYFRKSLFKTDGTEIVLVCLKQGQKVERHNHGKSNCVVNCLRGSFDEKLYDPSGREYNGTIGDGGLQGVKAGWEHEVVGTSDETVLLNFYSPPLES